MPLVVAGELVRSAPGEIYAAEDGDLYELGPAFAERSCELTPPGQSCEDVQVAFVSSPLSLPMVMGAAAFKGAVGIAAIRLVSAGALVAGMTILWRRLAHRSRQAGSALVVTALLLTPLTLNVVTLGQTTPLLFLSVVGGITAVERDPRRRAAAAALWVVCIAFKVFPVVPGIVLVAQRRWRFLGTAAAVALTLALAAALLGAPGWAEFASATAALSTRPSRTPTTAPSTRSRAGSTHSTTGRGGCCRWAAEPPWWRSAGGRGCAEPMTTRNGRWPGSPRSSSCRSVWAHYLWICIGVIGVVLAGRAVDDKIIRVLPAAAAASLLVAVPDASGGSAEPWVQLRSSPRPWRWPPGC